jgi:hypothetical protein
VTTRPRLAPEICARAKALYERYGWTFTCERLGISSSTLWALRHRDFQPVRRDVRPIPHDFTLVADGRSTTWLQSHYRARPAVVARWLREVRPIRPKCGTKAFPVPSDLAAIAERHTVKGIAKHYGVHWQTAKKWLLGIAPEPVDRRAGWAERRFWSAA